MNYDEMTDQGMAEAYRKLDAILGIVQTLKAQEVLAAKATADLDNERAHSQRYHQINNARNRDVARLGLEAYRLIYAAITHMNASDAKRETPEMRLDRAKWAEQWGAWREDCREAAIWEEEQDPEFDPNSEGRF